MMDSLRAWLLSLAGAALLTALAAMFPTSESLRRIVKAHRRRCADVSAVFAARGV